MNACSGSIERINDAIYGLGSEVEREVRLGMKESARALDDCPVVPFCHAVLLGCIAHGGFVANTALE